MMATTIENAFWWENEIVLLANLINICNPSATTTAHRSLGCSRDPVLILANRCSNM
jgi:hypothetical protein